MKNIIFLFIIIFSTALLGCNESSENKIPSAGSVRGKTKEMERSTDSAGTVEGQRLHIKPYAPEGNFTSSQKAKSQPPKDSSAGDVEKQRLHIEPY